MPFHQATSTLAPPLSEKLENNSFILQVKYVC